MKKTGGRWDPKEGPVYFVASAIDQLTIVKQSCMNFLCAVNEITSDARVQKLQALVADRNVFIDSGVFFLATSHAEKYNLSMDQALSIPPDEIDGYQELFEKYVDVIRKVGDKAWGYVEIDLGGCVNKVKTRRRLEKLGLSPIPVYHPLNDGWDYFDELAKNYDRICVGNVVMADRETRKRILATAWERKRKYPNLWIHLLGYTPNEWLNAYPVNSCDSSTWLALVRWPGAHKARVACQPFSVMDHNYTYDLSTEGDEKTEGCQKAWALGAYEAQMITGNLRALLADYAASGIR